MVNVYFRNGIFYVTFFMLAGVTKCLRAGQQAQFKYLSRRNCLHAVLLKNIF
jgi:hypothetical protein